MSQVIVYSTAVCSFCVRAKALLEREGISFREVRIDANADARAEYTRATNGARTVPQILVDGRLIGGFTELVEFERSGGLDRLKGSAPI